MPEQPILSLYERVHTMKKSKAPKEGKPHNAGKLADALHVPMNMLSGSSHMELNGNREVIVDGCGGVLEYDCDVVRIKSGKLIVKFSGRDLNIKCLTADSLVVEGFITAIEFIV